MNLRRKRFVSLIKLNHLRMLLQLDFLLKQQLRRSVRIDCQIDKSNHFLNYLVRELFEIVEFNVESNLLI